MRDYYKDLGLSHECSPEEISDAFRKLALKRSDFSALNKIAEAYEVLSDPEKRKNYDLFGEFVFKEGLNQGGKFIPGYQFNNNTAEIMLKFFGTAHPFFIENPSVKYESAAKPPGDIIIEVPCTLEELFLGCRKSVQYRNAKGETLWKALEIQPGCENGQKFIFYGEGEVSEFYPSSNLVFVIKELPHQKFKRDGKNLIHTARISLLHALSGHSIEIVRKTQETLDKKKIIASFDTVIAHGTTKVIPKQGLLNKGNLIIKVEVEFPKYISTESKEKLLNILT